MQTFVPEYDYAPSAFVLDRMRLGKQRVECLQILNTIIAGEHARGWKNHPAVTMWRGHEYALVQYSYAVCDEWVSRGYVDNCKTKIAETYGAFRATHDTNDDMFPDWWGDARVHESHKSNLIRKDSDHYSQYWDSVSSDRPYFWPTPAKERILS
jgi:hypothetical protein